MNTETKYFWWTRVFSFVNSANEKIKKISYWYATFRSDVVEHSFSIFKTLLADNHKSFKFLNLAKYLIIGQCATVELLQFVISTNIFYYKSSGSAFASVSDKTLICI